MSRISGRELLCDMGYEDAVVFENPDFDAAIIGVTTEGCAVYDYDQMVSSLVEEDDMEELEAWSSLTITLCGRFPVPGRWRPLWCIYSGRRTWRTHDHCNRQEP